VDEELLTEALIKAFNHIRYNSDLYTKKWEKDLESEGPLIRHRENQLIKVSNTAVPSKKQKI